MRRIERSAVGAPHSTTKPGTSTTGIASPTRPTKNVLPRSFFQTRSKSVSWSPLVDRVAERLDQVAPLGAATRIVGSRNFRVGWRIDYVLASAAVIPFVRAAFFQPHVGGSDHCPVGVDLEAGILA